MSKLSPTETILAFALYILILAFAWSSSKWRPVAWGMVLIPLAILLVTRFNTIEQSFRQIGG